MGSRADFYIREKDEKMKWIGSIFKRGEPWYIPINILNQKNKAMFLEEVNEYLKLVPSSKEWPWDWPDSFMTDYSYIFDVVSEKVIAYIAVDKMLFDPIKVIKGEDLKSAEIKGAPDFPILGEDPYAKHFTEAM